MEHENKPFSVEQFMDGLKKNIDRVREYAPWRVRVR